MIAAAAPAADPYLHAYYIAAILGSSTTVIIAVYAAYRKHERNKAVKVTEQAHLLRQLYEAIVGAPATLDSPSPGPGLMERVKTIETDIASVRIEVAAVKKEVTPNGGDTNRLGDRVKRLEERQKEQHHHD